MSIDKIESTFINWSFLLLGTRKLTRAIVYILSFLFHRANIGCYFSKSLQLVIYSEFSRRLSLVVRSSKSTHGLTRRIAHIRNLIIVTTTRSFFYFPFPLTTIVLGRYFYDFEREPLRGARRCRSIRYTLINIDWKYFQKKKGIFLPSILKQRKIAQKCTWRKRRSCLFAISVTNRIWKTPIGIITWLHTLLFIHNSARL